MWSRMWSTVCCAFAAHLPAGTLASGATRPHHAKQRENLLAEQHNNQSAKCSLPRINQEKLLNRQDGRFFVSSFCPPRERRRGKKKGLNMQNARVTSEMQQFPDIISTAFHVRRRLYFRFPTLVCSEQAVACGFRLRPVVSLRCLTSPPVTQHRCE